VHWPGDDFAIPVLVAFFAVAAGLLPLAVRHSVIGGGSAHTAAAQDLV
jgi:hypothetical protein